MELSLSVLVRHSCPSHRWEGQLSWLMEYIRRCDRTITLGDGSCDRTITAILPVRMRCTYTMVFHIQVCDVRGCDLLQWC